MLVNCAGECGTVLLLKEVSDALQKQMDKSLEKDERLSIKFHLYYLCKKCKAKQDHEKLVAPTMQVV